MDPDRGPDGLGGGGDHVAAGRIAQTSDLHAADALGVTVIVPTAPGDMASFQSSRRLCAVLTVLWSADQPAGPVNVTTLSATET